MHSNETLKVARLYLRAEAHIATCKQGKSRRRR